MELIQEIISFFFGKNFPSVSIIVWLLPLMILYSACCLEVAYRAKSKWSWKVGYSRKFFHFSIFSMAGVLQFLYGVSTVFILGWAVTLMIVYILVRRGHSRYYDVLARPQDEPYATRYIAYPYLATFFGGVCSNLFFTGAAPMAGYLIAGFGDAVGEPVGTKWGRHRYPVFSWGSSVKTYRSVEGSLGVFIACFIAFLLVLYSFQADIIWLKILIAAFIATLVEAISPHGWDNFTSQMTGALLIHFFLLP